MVREQIIKVLTFFIMLPLNVGISIHDFWEDWKKEVSKQLNNIRR